MFLLFFGCLLALPLQVPPYKYHQVKTSFENHRVAKAEELVNAARCVSPKLQIQLQHMSYEQPECLSDLQSRLCRALLSLVLIAYLAAGSATILTPCCATTQQ